MSPSATKFATRNSNGHPPRRTTPQSHKLSGVAIPTASPPSTTTRPCPYPYPWGPEYGVQPEDDFQSEGTPYDPRAIVRVLIPVSIAGWLLFGVVCVLCINGRGKAGRWIPEWYLDSEGTRRDRALVVAWWAAVMVLWPVILPVLLVRRGVRGVRKGVEVVRAWVVLRREGRMLQRREGEGEEDV